MLYIKIGKSTTKNTGLRIVDESDKETGSKNLKTNTNLNYVHYLYYNWNTLHRSRPRGWFALLHSSSVQLRFVPEVGHPEGLLVIQVLPNEEPGEGNSKPDVAGGDAEDCHLTFAWELSTSSCGSSQGISESQWWWGTRCSRSSSEGTVKSP